jgi:glycosyltransferase involved in cell wall biosynthesis
VPAPAGAGLAADADSAGANGAGVDAADAENADIAAATPRGGATPVAEAGAGAGEAEAVALPLASALPLFEPLARDDTAWKPDLVEASRDHANLEHDGGSTLRHQAPASARDDSAPVREPPQARVGRQAATGRLAQDRDGGSAMAKAPARLAPPLAAMGADPRRRFARVAIVHYWLVTMRGGERVLERLLRLFPDADIFTHVYDPAAMPESIRRHKVTTSFIQRLPGARKHYQSYLPLMPMALEHLDLRGYDLVISSESGPAKGVITAPDALHLSYVHSPMRYLWDHYHDYRDAAGMVSRAVMPLLCHRLRAWDVSSAARVDRILANSHFVQRRIAKAWRREAAVLHPPVDIDLFGPGAQSGADTVGPAWLWVGQMVPYKRPDLAIDAFNALGLPLVMVGDGPMAAAMRRRAGPTITILPRLDFAALRRAYAQCRALVFPAEEDFGIVPVEVIASGRPVLAYAGGGALDSVTQDVSGQFFARQSVDSLIAGVEAMEAWLPHFDPAAAMADARRFAPAHFDQGLLAALE